jgi:hypothetical protein
MAGILYVDRGSVVSNLWEGKLEGWPVDYDSVPLYTGTGSPGIIRTEYRSPRILTTWNTEVSEPVSKNAKFIVPLWGPGLRSPGAHCKAIQSPLNWAAGPPEMLEPPAD